MNNELYHHLRAVSSSIILCEGEREKKLTTWRILFSVSYTVQSCGTRRAGEMVVLTIPLFFSSKNAKLNGSGSSRLLRQLKAR